MTRWLGLAALVLATDQLSKYLLALLLAAGAIEVTPFFNLVLVRNPGAAFSFLSDASGWQRELFIAIALAATVWIAKVGPFSWDGLMAFWFNMVLYVPWQFIVYLCVYRAIKNQPDHELANAHLLPGARYA